jgi:hypothetical protein
MAKTPRRNRHRRQSLEQRRAKLELRFWMIREYLAITRQALLVAAIVLALIKMLN